MINEIRTQFQKQKIERLTKTIAKLTSENAALSAENNMLKRRIEDISKDCAEAVDRLSSIEQEYGSAILEANEIRDKYQELIDRASYEFRSYKKRIAMIVDA